MSELTFTESEIRAAAPPNWHEAAASELLARAKENRAVEELKYIQVQFTHGGRIYVYECENAKVGDWVVAPPNSVSNSPQCLRVRALGRGSGQPKHLTIRRAHLVPSAIARGTDWAYSSALAYSSAPMSASSAWASEVMEHLGFEDEVHVASAGEPVTMFIGAPAKVTARYDRGRDQITISAKKV